MQPELPFVAGVLGHEGPMLVGVPLDRSQFIISVNGPHLLFKALQLRTSLHLQDGADYSAFVSLARGFVATAHCGHSEPLNVRIQVAGEDVSPYLTIGTGPPSMYMSNLRFATVDGATFGELCDRTVNAFGRATYMLALVPIADLTSGHVHPMSGDDDHAVPGGASVLSVESDSTERPPYRIESALRRRRGD